MRWVDIVCVAWQIVCTRDLESFERVGDRQPFITASPKGSPHYCQGPQPSEPSGPSEPSFSDLHARQSLANCERFGACSGQIMPPSRPVIGTDGNLRFYYFGGRSRGHGAEVANPFVPPACPPPFPLRARSPSLACGRCANEAWWLAQR